MTLIRFLPVLVATVALSSTAHAQTPPGSLAPPGNSGIDQYVETIPTAKGPTRPGSGDSRTGTDNARPGTDDEPSASMDALPESTRSALRERGVDGAAVERLVRDSDSSPRSAGSPRSAPVRGSKQATNGTDRSVVDAATSTGGGVLGTTLGRGVGGSEGTGMGLALPLLLVAILVGAVALALARHRQAAGR